MGRRRTISLFVWVKEFVNAKFKMYRTIFKCSSLLTNELVRDLQSVRFPQLQKSFGKTVYFKITLGLLC